MIASVLAAVSPRFSRRLPWLVAAQSNTSDIARGTWRGLARARLLRVGRALGTWMLLIGLVILVGPTAAEAQQATPAGPAPWRVYFGGSALVSSQPAGGDFVPGVPGLGGTGFGLSAVVGAGGRVSVEAEITRAGSLNLSWPVGLLSISYRDTLLSTFVRWRTNPAGRVYIEPVGGVTLAFGHGTEVTDLQPSYTQPFSRTSLGLGGGVDVLVPIAARVSIAGSARLHRLICSDPATYKAEEIAPALGAWIAQVGGGVQVSWARSSSPASDIPGPTGRGNAGGQASPHRGYVGGAITVSHQPDGYADGSYLSAPLGGTGAGFSGIVGGFFTPNLSLEAEVSIGPALTAEQWTYGGATRNSTSYQDTLLSAFLRWQALRFTRLAIEPVGGLTVTAGHAARTAVDHYPHYAFPDEWGAPYDASVTRIRFGIGGGADLVVPATRSMAITASFRLHVLDRDDEPYERPELGIGPWIIQFGGGLRWTF